MICQFINITLTIFVIFFFLLRMPKKKKMINVENAKIFIACAKFDCNYIQSCVPCISCGFLFVRVVCERESV